MFDENFSLEVIHFVLDANGEQPVGIELKRFALSVQCPHRDVLSTFHFFKNTRYRQTAFLAVRGATAGDYFRVDEDLKLVVRLRNVDNNDALMDVDLGSCQADSRRGVHGIRHIFD